MKPVTVQRVTREGLATYRADDRALAGFEGLDHHGATARR